MTPQTFSQKVWEASKTSGKDSVLCGFVSTVGCVLLRAVVPCLIGVVIGFFFFRFVCNFFIKDQSHPAIKACRDFENKYPWLNMGFLALLVFYFAPKYADSKWFKNPTFWGGMLSGSFLGTNYHSKK